MAARINASHTFRHDHDFGLADRTVQGMKLTVDVRDAHVIKIDESNPSDTAAGQSFCRPGAHTADADHANVGSCQDLQGFLAVEPLDAAETLRKIIGHGRYLSDGIALCGLDFYCAALLRNF